MHILSVHRRGAPGQEYGVTLSHSSMKNPDHQPPAPLLAPGTAISIASNKHKETHQQSHAYRHVCILTCTHKPRHTHSQYLYAEYILFVLSYFVYNFKHPLPFAPFHQEGVDSSPPAAISPTLPPPASSSNNTMADSCPYLPFQSYRLCPNLQQPTGPWSRPPSAPGPPGEKSCRKSLGSGGHTDTS